MPSDDFKKYTEANRAAWNEVMPLHKKHRRLDLDTAFAGAGFSVLDEFIGARLELVGVAGRDVAQLSCNNGQELLSLLNMGARYGLGIDISDAAIEEACRLRDIAGSNADFVRADVYDVGVEYDGRFDLLLVTVGALAWLPDLAAYFALAARMLKPGGRLLVYEMHPILNALPQKDDPEFAHPLQFGLPYFSREPFAYNDGIDYIGGTSYAARTSYNFNHGLGDIVNSIVRAGFEIEALDEFPHDISNLFAETAAAALIPMCFILQARKR